MNQSFCSRCRTDFSIKVIDFFGIQVKLQIWDVTDGCDIDLFSVPVFSRFDGRKLQQFAAAIIFVYDVSDAESLHKVKQNILDCARNFESDGCAKVLVGNKRDLLYGRVIGSAEAQALAAEHGMMYFETSAKTPACWDAVEAGQVEACLLEALPRELVGIVCGYAAGSLSKMLTEIVASAGKFRAFVKEREDRGTLLKAKSEWQDGKRCHFCKKDFTFFFRRHHCRACCWPCCGPCSPHRLVLPESQPSRRAVNIASGARHKSRKRHRVCKQCAKNITSLRRLLSSSSSSSS